jgi:hypothetical protein
MAINGVPCWWEEKYRTHFVMILLRLDVAAQFLRFWLLVIFCYRGARTAPAETLRFVFNLWDAVRPPKEELFPAAGMRVERTLQAVAVAVS